jgi:glycosyltransferase involved in cell wall biosynthesis
VQTHAVTEIIVVDDGSTDHTVSIASAFGGPVRVVVQQNQGASVARNRALDEARADFIAFVDADDLWHPEKLERQLAYLHAHPDVGTVVSSFTVFGLARAERAVAMSDAALRGLRSLDFLTSPRIHPSTMVVRGDVARSVRFPAGITGCEDVIYATLLRMRGPIGAVDEPLMRRREHTSQETRTADHFRRALSGRLAWGQTNAELLGAAPRDVRDAILHGALDDVLARYWSRELGKFAAMRHDLLAMWPADAPRPTVLDRPLPPTVLLLAKDSFDRLIGRR